ncbi:DUF2274 domain-containing protein [Bordetella bronchiseptica]|uniref:DUF2274 domain-containing protein n=1 Tax=Bordetella bronchiseptica TaxID=518 RepID=UPI0009B83FF8|nr:DUF2274 domain-containing protein [Bordetella bronchiseptica]
MPSPIPDEPLPKQETVQLTISLPAELKDALDRYAATLWPSLWTEGRCCYACHMLARFTQTDRGYRCAYRTL